MCIVDLLFITALGLAIVLHTLSSMEDSELEEPTHTDFVLYGIYKDRLVYSNIILNGISRESFLQSNPLCAFYYKRENTYCISSGTHNSKVDIIPEKTARRLYPGDFN